MLSQLTHWNPMYMPVYQHLYHIPTYLSICCGQNYLKNPNTTTYLSVLNISSLIPMYPANTGLIHASIYVHRTRKVLGFIRKQSHMNAYTRGIEAHQGTQTHLHACAHVDDILEKRSYIVGICSVYQVIQQIPVYVPMYQHLVL